MFTGHPADNIGMEISCGIHGLTKAIVENIGKGKRRLRCPKCRYSRMLRARRRRKLELVALLGGQCKNCGYKKSVWALDFHHRDKDSKSFGIGQKLGTISKNKLMVEALKCDLLCRNCHAEVEEKECVADDSVEKEVYVIVTTPV